MNNKFVLNLSIILIILAVLAFFAFSSPKKNDGEFVQYDLAGIENIPNSFEKAITQRIFLFPKDYGNHEEFQTEWWYYTGNLLDSEGRHFGYQLTFFRRGINSNNKIIRESDWATNQMYFAHFTITDTENERHYQKEMMARGALDLAGAKSEELFEVWLYDWRVEQKSEEEFLLVASAQDFSINLILKDLKGPVLQGDSGLSKKGDQPGNASYYFSQTRLLSNGTITIGGDSYSVQGFSWMDHEFGSSTLGENQIGWDWFSLQFGNNEELMIFQIRQDDNRISENSSGLLVKNDSNTRSFGAEDFSLKVLDQWETDDGYIYPIKWSILIESEDLELTLEPVIKQQENEFFFRYWEGAVKVTGIKNGQKISGYGYVELTGYAQSMKGVF